MDTLRCLNDGDDCAGTVEHHTLDGIKWWPRCDAHQRQRVERYEGSIERDAQSPLAPAWFDPTYAGESWDED